MRNANNVEFDRADATKPACLDRDAFRAAWLAMQNCPIDLLRDDDDDEQCRALGVAISAHLAACS